MIFPPTPQGQAGQILSLDDYLKRQEKGVTTPEQERLIREALRASPLPDGIIPAASLPDATIPPAPVAYVIHRHTHRCLACNTESRWSQTFSLFHSKTHWDKSRIRHLVPTTALEWNIPLHTQDLPPTSTPCCALCVEPTQDHLATLPRPPIPQAIVKSTPTKPTPAPRATTKAPATPVTIDDLLS